MDIEADAQHVWKALTDTHELACWCSPKAEIRACAGGLFRASVDRVTELEARIDVFDAPRRLRLIYLPCDALPPADTAIVDDFILDARGSTTIVRLLGSGIPRGAEWDGPYLRLRTGWERAMARLKVLVEKSQNN